MNDPGTKRKWTLRGKMLRWLGLTSGLVAVSLFATGIWFVESSADRQVDAFLSKEMDKIRAAFAFQEVDGTAFLAVADELSRLHQSSRFAWRVWAPGGEHLIGEFGVPESLQHGAPAASPLDNSIAASDGYVWRSTQLDSGVIIGLMLDQAPHRTFVDQYVRITALTMAMGFLCIFLVGQAFSTRVSQLLARIAARLREVQASSDRIDLQVDDLPTEISEVAEALEGMLLKIREETKASRVLIAGMAHELRAPIQNLIGETEVTLIAERSGERYRDVLLSHLEELRYLGDGVHNLVSLCSAKKSADAKQSESFDLYKEVRFRLEREVRRAERIPVELVFESGGDLSLHGDREALLTAMRNLACNALDWVPQGGRVEIIFRPDTEKIQVLVNDNGPGVPEEMRERIFEPFFRAPSAEGKRSGYGLGLALAHSAVLAQGGSIEVGTSDLGGASFKINLPRERPPHSGDQGIAEPFAVDL
ncbi:MAG: signal transduction histidine kinase [Candidatus Paceibacteria bacterium]|jgi:signal transduction histidine kinase